MYNENKLYNNDVIHTFKKNHLPHYDYQPISPFNCIYRVLNKNVTLEIYAKIKLYICRKIVTFLLKNVPKTTPTRINSTQHGQMDLVNTDWDWYLLCSRIIYKPRHAYTQRYEICFYLNLIFFFKIKQMPNILFKNYFY